MPILKHYNRDYFNHWSNDMAYILGFLFADGNLIKTKRNTYFISFYSADLFLIRKIKKKINLEQKISKRSSNGGRVYRIQVGSKKWFYDLSKLRLTPNKSKRMRLPVIPKKFVGDFIRGYFDGDGNVWVGRLHKDRKISSLTIQSAFTSASKLFLLDLKKILISLGLKGGSVYDSKVSNFSRLNLSVNDSLKLYVIMYKMEPSLFLKRKKKVFEQFMRLRV